MTTQSGSAVAYLLLRAWPRPKGWEIGASAALAGLPALALAVLNPGALANYLLCAGPVAALLLGLDSLLRVSGLVVSLRRGRALEDLLASGLGPRDLLAPLSDHAAQRTGAVVASVGGGLALATGLLVWHQVAASPTSPSFVLHRDILTAAMGPPVMAYLLAPILAMLLVGLGSGWAVAAALGSAPRCLAMLGLMVLAGGGAISSDFFDAPRASLGLAALSGILGLLGWRTAARALRMGHPEGSPRRARRRAGRQENPVLFREAVRGRGGCLRPLLLLALPALGAWAALAEEVPSGLWLGLAGLWLGLFATAAWRASAAFAEEREGRSLEPLLATRLTLPEFEAGWTAAVTRPLVPTGLAAGVLVGLAAFQPDLFLPGDAGDWLHRAGPSTRVAVTGLLALMAAGLGLAVPRAGARVGLWASAGAATRQEARGRLLGGVAASLGLVLLGWAVPLFSAAYTMEWLHLHGNQGHWFELGGLLGFPLLAACGVCLGLEAWSRGPLGRLLQAAWGGDPPAPSRGGPVGRWLEGAVIHLWSPGRLLLLPAAAGALLSVWAESGLRTVRSLDEAAFFVLLIAGLGLFSASLAWLALWRPLAAVWEALERRGWPVGATVLFGLAAATLAAFSVLLAMMALPGTRAEEARMLLLVPLLGPPLALQPRLRAASQGSGLATQRKLQ